jgi:hypothetical protein
MASTASTLLKIELQATGENDGTWGTKANTAMARIEEAIAGYTAITMVNANYTLDDTQYVENTTTTAESHLAIIKVNGTPNASYKVVVPLRTKIYLIWNNVTTEDITVGGATGDTVTVTNGNLAWVFCDGTNVEFASPLFSPAGAIPTASVTGLSGTNTGDEVAATTSTAGVVEKSTSAENLVGTSDTVYPSVAGVTEIATQLDATPATDHTAVGPQTNTLNAGYSSTIMDLVYMGSGGKWLEADSDATGTSINMLAIALEAKTDTQAMNVALPGSFVRDDTWNWTIGVPLYVSGTLGAITATAPSGSGDVVRTVGFAVTADVIWFQPSPDYLTVA